MQSVAGTETGTEEEEMETVWGGVAGATADPGCRLAEITLVSYAGAVPQTVTGTAAGTKAC